MERHDSFQDRIRVLRALLRHEDTPKNTNEVAGSSQLRACRTRVELRALRREGGVSQIQSGKWFLSRRQAGAARVLIATVERGEREWERLRVAAAERRRAGALATQTVPPPRVSAHTFEEVLRCGFSGGKMFGAQLIVTTKPPRE